MIREKRLICYLDIETTGLSRERDDVTVVGVVDGDGAYRGYIRGRNLHLAAADLRVFDVLYTFNGETFDLPFLRRLGFLLPYHASHYDMRDVMRDLGYVGGQKAIENRLGFRRSSVGINGAGAVRLWRAYESGDASALRALLRYNEDDCRNLAKLVGYARAQGVRLPC